MRPQDLGHALTNLGAATVNALASLGVAMIDHPQDALAVAAGVALMAVSAGGEATGVALSATGVGAIVGVPVAAVSAAGVVAGATVALAAMGDLAGHAAGEDRTRVVGGAGPRLQPAEKRKLGNLADRADELARDVLRSRGAGARNVRGGDLHSDYGEWTLRNLAHAAARGDEHAEAWIKMIKQAGTQGKGGK
jgi:hypothetical protein